MQIPPNNKAAIEEKYEDEETLLHDLLKEVDPKMGEYFHSRDRRRVINALFKYFKHAMHNDLSVTHDGGLKESDILLNADSKCRKLRYYPVLIWMRAAPSILEQRITKRIDEMIDRMGGLQEIFDLFTKSEEESLMLDFEKGIL